MPTVIDIKSSISVVPVVRASVVVVPVAEPTPHVIEVATGASVSADLLFFKENFVVDGGRPLSSYRAIDFIDGGKP